MRWIKTGLISNVTDGWEHWGTAITDNKINLVSGGTSLPVIDTNPNVMVVFDPQVDYLYMTQFFFKLLFKDKIQQIYGDAITCSDSECMFKTQCALIQKKSLIISFNIGPTKEQSQNIQVDLEEYAFDAPEISSDGTGSKVCFLPMMTSDPQQQMDVWNTIFLGSMFLNKYFVSHDLNRNENDVFDNNFRPTVGIIEKTKYEP